MKKSIIVICLVLFYYTSSEGQWYVRKYNVTDINALSKEQLEESLRVTKTDMYVSAVIAGLGGLIITIEALTPYDIEEDENPTLIVQLLGEKNTSNGIKIVGAGIMVGGTLAFLNYLGRNGRIKSTLNMNFPSSGTLNLSPTMVMGRSIQSVCFGINLTYHF